MTGRRKPDWLKKSRAEPVYTGPPFFVTDFSRVKYGKPFYPA
jgi:hypothetical protein